MANYKTKAELDFEKEVVNQLTVGHNQWVERKDLYEATPEQLWANLREKINNNNYAVLQGQPLTDQEFGRVQRAIEVQTPYEAAQLLAAENGIGKIVIERDDAQLDKVTLELFWKADVAGGKSSYEIVRQAVRPKGTNINGDDQDRRFDVTLLINGLPLIQLEFKKSTVELGQAFTQIKKYAAESKYTGIYSLLQMFVIMSPDSSAYFANCEPGHFNDSFIFHWRTRDNKPVEDGLKFTQQVLNIPMAHKLVSEYTVMDEERKSLILLRPYQIFVLPGQKIYNATANDRLERYCSRAGIPVISVHGLRHTHASLLLYAGVSIGSVARRLGHSNMNTTQRTYLHVIQELENQDTDKIMRYLTTLM
ncbi:MAG: type I restriction endonuclease [Oenococcus sp.]|uniref:type I restriction endonuclease n=1 Tax=Oenococcus TaxID=46254 RepID=UPI0021E79F3A|nr:type I restriction endonuclease [Oenococcus kitaharae]MCV3295975.1 type I restriction endonuclease [Oenococcus kitaharae]